MNLSCSLRLLAINFYKSHKAIRHIRTSHVVLNNIGQTMKAKKFMYVKAFDGEPKRSDFELVEEELPPLKDGEFLCKALYLSVDPYMRPYMAAYHKPGITMIGTQIAQIVESKNSEFPKDKYVFGNFGWRDYTISAGGNLSEVHLLPDFGDLPLSLGLGALGMPGNTAYFGFLEICKPKENETVVVSGAAGAVGSHVGQIAKIKKCKVIGICGSDDKCKWLTEELGFDHAINYKTDDIDKQIRTFAPNGVDCYFDNVGGETSSMVIKNMAKYGRISVCGSISSYNASHATLPKVTIIQPFMIFKELKMEGFIVYRWMHCWFDGIKQNMEWIKEGKLKYRETVTEGFENMFEAFSSMLKGGNVGKAIVKAKV